MKIRSLLAGLLLLPLCLTACSKSESTDAPYYTRDDFSKKDLSEFVTLGSYDGVEYESIEISEQEVTKLLNTKLAESSYVTQKDGIKEGKVIDGDICKIDYVGKKDGVAFEGGTGSYDLEIGSGSFIPGFEEGLIGAEIGSTVDLDLTFPENYGKEELNGQDVVFTVTIHEVSRKEYKELTDKLAATLDNTVKTADEYRTKLEKQLHDEAMEEKLATLWDTVVENSTFSDTLPEELLVLSRAYYVAFYTNQATQGKYDSLDAFLAAQNVTEEQFQADTETFAKLKTQHYLTALAICEAEGLTLSDEEFEKRVTELAKSAGFDDVESYYKASGGDLLLHVEFALQDATAFVQEHAVEK